MIKLWLSFIIFLLLSGCGSDERIEVVESCNIESPLNVAELPSNKDFKIVGWALDNQTLTVPEKISIEFYGNDRKTFAATRLRRPDIVSSFKSNNVEMAGFEVHVPANSLTTGQYELVIEQETPLHKIKCVKGHAININ